jgi:hypothetical protein
MMKRVCVAIKGSMRRSLDHGTVKGGVYMKIHRQLYRTTYTCMHTCTKISVYTTGDQC